jgi:hypothetical protein
MRKCSGTQAKVLLGRLDETMRSRILMLLWIAWHLRNDLIHCDGRETIELSVSFLETYAVVESQNHTGQEGQTRKSKRPCMIQERAPKRSHHETANPSSVSAICLLGRHSWAWPALKTLEPLQIKGEIVRMDWLGTRTNRTAASAEACLGQCCMCSLRSFGSRVNDPGIWTVHGDAWSTNPDRLLFLMCFRKEVIPYENCRPGLRGDVNAQGLTVVDLPGPTEQVLRRLPGPGCTEPDLVTAGFV